MKLKIIITQTFLKEYKKTCRNTSIQLLTKAIFAQKNIGSIYLKRPILKLKLQIGNIHVRIAWKYMEDTLLFFPIIIYKKSNKNLWNNLTWDSIKNNIDNKMQKLYNDLQEWNHEVFEQ